MKHGINEEKQSEMLHSYLQLLLLKIHTKYKKNQTFVAVSLIPKTKQTKN